MKKTLTRVLSLVMVLAMFASAMPLAMADGEVITAVTSVSPSSATLEVGETVTLTATIEPATATADLDWASTSSAIASVADGVVTANGVGSCQIHARSAADSSIKAVAYITVVEAEEEEPELIVPTISPSAMTINFGETKNLPTITVGDLEEGTDYTVNWYVEHSTRLEIDESTKTVTAIGTQNSRLGAEIVPLDDTLQFSTTKLYCSVTVTNELALNISKTLIEISEDASTMTLEEPVLTGDNASDYEIKSYTYSRVSDSVVNVDIDDNTLEPVTAGRDVLTLEAVVIGENNTRVSVPSVTINVSVYKEADDIVAYMKDSVSYFTFDSETALDELTLDGTDYVDSTFSNTVELLLNDVNSESPTDRGNWASYTLYFDDVEGAGGTLSLTTLSNLQYKGVAMSALSKVKFTKDSSANARSTFDYEIRDEKGYLMTVGTLYIDYDGSDAIVYETDFDTSVTFDEDDFYDYYEEYGSTGTLSYVKFTTLPSSSYGALYTSDSESTKVTLSDKFKYNYSSSSSNEDLDEVTFVPNSSRTSDFTVSIPFTAYSTTSKYVTGYVNIVVSDGDADGDIVYTTDFDTSITFKEEDFEEFWDDNASGDLSYVKFTTLPSSSYGALYTTAKETTKVATSYKFRPDYSSSSSYYDLDTVTFKPSSSRSSDYSVEIPFTAYGTNSKSVTGTVVIKVTDDDATGDTITSLGIYLGHSGYKFDDAIAEEFEDEKGKDLSYVTFTQPGISYGKLYYDYDSLMDNKEVTSSVKFYYEPDDDDNVEDLADVWFIPAAGFKGTVKLKYTAYGKNGSSEYEGTLALKVSSKTKSTYFKDVTASSYSWASDAVDFLRYNEIVNGTNDANTQYSPKNSITRAHFMLMLYRAFLEEDYGSYSVTSNFADITKGTSAYSKELYQAVGVAKSLGIATGDGTNYYPNKSISREEAMTLIYRTLDKLNLDLEYTGTKDTGDFSDYSSVSTYAKDPLEYLIEHGVVVGDSGKINPKSNITRAEMAVILHRVLTY